MNVKVRRGLLAVGSMLLLPLSGACVAASSSHTVFNGVWQVRERVTELRTSEGKPPPLLPASLALYEERRAAGRTQAANFDGTLKCQPHGIPRLLHERMPVEIMVQPDQVVFMHQWNRLARWVHLDKEHWEPPGPTYLGQSVGRWEGDTLLIDTNGLNAETVLDAAGMPHSEQLRVVERWQPLNNGRTLRVQVRIEDGATFASPWETVLHFDRRPNLKIAEDVCVERLRLPQYR